MNVPEPVTFVINRLENELCCQDGNKPTITKNIRQHSSPGKGWIAEVKISGNHTGMLSLMPTAQRLNYGSISWDLERNAIIITGKINDIEVSIFIVRKTGGF